MASLINEKVVEIHHWNESLFSFKTTRSQSFTFENGHFVMMGLMIDNKPLLRAYSIASPNYADYLEFFSIKVPNGPLTSKLQYVKPGDEVVISTKPTGTLVADNLLPGKRLYLLSTGTGLAPFMSIIRDPEIYDKYEHIVLTHGVRALSDLAYQHFIINDLPKTPYFGELIQEKLKYFPIVTREAYVNQGRLTEWLESGKLAEQLDLPSPSIEEDRFMLCGGPSMLKSLGEILQNAGFVESRHGKQAHYVIERAFVEK